MAGLIKHKLTVQPLVVLTYFFCFVPTAYSDGVRGDVVVDYQRPFELDSDAEAMAAVGSNHRQLSLSGISNNRTETRQ